MSRTVPVRAAKKRAAIPGVARRQELARTSATRSSGALNAPSWSETGESHTLVANALARLTPAAGPTTTPRCCPRPGVFMPLATGAPAPTCPCHERRVIAGAYERRSLRGALRAHAPP